jgi:hypothetical protein
MLILLSLILLQYPAVTPRGRCSGVRIRLGRNVMTIMSRNIARAVLFFLLFAFSLSVSWAGLIEGSTATSRSNVDVATGQVFIYDGGVFNNLEQVTTFFWFGHQFSGSRFMTPILFLEQADGLFAVVGIGSGRTVTSSGSAQSFAFGLTQGTDTTGPTGIYHFGFVNGLVDNNGNQISSSAGTVDMVSPMEACCGVDGTSENDWVYTPGVAMPNVGINQTFYLPGNTGTYPLNNQTTQVDRTYSAFLTGTQAIPEPSTFTLFTSGAGVLLAGLLRFRRKPQLNK